MLKKQNPKSLNLSCLVFSNLVDLAQKSNCTRFLTVRGFSKYLGINLLTKSTNYTNCQFDQHSPI